MADIPTEQPGEQDTALSEVLALYAPLLAGPRQASPVDRQISLLVDEAVGVWSRPGFDTFLSVASLRFTPFDYQLQMETRNEICYDESRDDRAGA